MRNEMYRQKKIARHKMRRKLREAQYRQETFDDRKIRIKSFFIAGSIHGARQIRKEIINEGNNK